MHLLLEETLREMHSELSRYDNRLVVLCDSTAAVCLSELLHALTTAESDASPPTLYYNRHYEPWERDKEKEVERMAAGMPAPSFSSS